MNSEGHSAGINMINEERRENSNLLELNRITSPALPFVFLLNTKIQAAFIFSLLKAAQYIVQYKVLLPLLISLVIFTTYYILGLSRACEEYSILMNSWLKKFSGELEVKFCNILKLRPSNIYIIKLLQLLREI